MSQDQPPLPRILIFAAGVTGGVLLALAAQVVIAHIGLDLAAVWREHFVTRAAQVRSAIAWWLIAAISFIGGFLIAAFVRYISLNWRRFRALRWLGSAALVTALAMAGDLAGTPSGLGPTANLIVNLAALFLFALLSTLGAFFALRR